MTTTKQPAKTTQQAQAAKPIWVNLRFVGGDRERNRSALVHGMPDIGARFDAEEGFGMVTWICFAPATDGSYKATIQIDVSS